MPIMNATRPGQSPLHTKSSKFQNVKFVIEMATILTAQPCKKVKVMVYYFVKSGHMDNLQIERNILKAMKMIDYTNKGYIFVKGLVVFSTEWETPLTREFTSRLSVSLQVSGYYWHEIGSLKEMFLNQHDKTCEVPEE